MGEDGFMAQTNPPQGDPAQGETKQRDPSQPRTFAGIPTWAVAIVGAGGLAVAAGFIGYWSGNQGSDSMAPVAYAASPSSATASGQPPFSPGPDGLYPTPTPVLTSSGADIFSGSQPPTPSLSPAPARTSTTSGAGADSFNPATVTPARTSSMATAPRTWSTPKSTRTSTKATTPVAATTSERATRTPSASKTSSPAVDEVKVAGPPSGLTVTTDDLSFGRCPSTFRTSVEVEVAYGTSSAAKAKWRASETGARGSATLQMTGYNKFAGTINGIPTKTAVVLTVVVTGPDGSTTNDPFEITHRC